MTSPVSELIELLSLERLEDNLFRGQSRDIGTRYVFGGQVLGQALSAAQAVLITTPPDAHGCPALRALTPLAGGVWPDWIGYVSSTAVYGDRAGGWHGSRCAPPPWPMICARSAPACPAGSTSPWPRPACSRSTPPRWTRWNRSGCPRLLRRGCGC